MVVMKADLSDDRMVAEMVAQMVEMMAALLEEKMVA